MSRCLIIHWLNLVLGWPTHQTLVNSSPLSRNTFDCSIWESPHFGTSDTPLFWIVLETKYVNFLDDQANPNPCLLLFASADFLRSPPARGCPTPAGFRRYLDKAEFRNNTKSQSLPALLLLHRVRRSYHRLSSTVQRLFDCQEYGTATEAAAVKEGMTTSRNHLIQHYITEAVLLYLLPGRGSQISLSGRYMTRLRRDTEGPMILMSKLKEQIKTYGVLQWVSPVNIVTLSRTEEATFMLDGAVKRTCLPGSLLQEDLRTLLWSDSDMVEDSTFVAPDCTMYTRFMRPGRMFTLRIRLTMAQVLTTKDVKATLAISRSYSVYGKVFMHEHTNNDINAFGLGTILTETYLLSHVTSVGAMGCIILACKLLHAYTAERVIIQL
ncbi:hypothetical protein C8R48DRAFT_667859 [Suillus tomentosus]|nr:hypothetical protein C8R48DRAFT_667859 [Suillus tomentosus]